MATCSKLVFYYMHAYSYLDYHVSLVSYVAIYLVCYVYLPITTKS